MDFSTLRIIEICIRLVMFGVSFYALQSLRVDLFKPGHTMQIQLTYLLLALALAELSSQFLLSLWIQYL